MEFTVFYVVKTLYAKILRESNVASPKMGICKEGISVFFEKQGDVIVK